MPNGDWERRITQLEVRVEERFNNVDKQLDDLPKRIKNGLPCNIHTEKMEAIKASVNWMWSALVLSVTSVITAFAILWNFVR